MNERINVIRNKIQQRALLMVGGDPARAGDLYFAETCMLIGASVVLEMPLDLKDKNQLISTPAGEEILSQLFEGQK